MERGIAIVLAFAENRGIGSRVILFQVLQDALSGAMWVLGCWGSFFMRSLVVVESGVSGRVLGGCLGLWGEFMVCAGFALECETGSVVRTEPGLF